MSDTNNKDANTLFQRLPKTVLPTHYDLTIQPFLDKFKFNGSVNIHLKVCWIVLFVLFHINFSVKLG